MILCAIYLGFGIKKNERRQAFVAVDARIGQRPLTSKGRYGYGWRQTFEGRDLKVAPTVLVVGGRTIQNAVTARPEAAAVLSLKHVGA